MAADVYQLVARAVFNGAARRSFFHTEWDVAGNCEDPVYVNLYGAPAALEASLSGSAMTMELVIWVPCRKCAPCLKRKRIMWYHRAMVETDVAARTWFGTLTFRPEEHMKAEYTIDDRDMTDTQRFLAIAAVEGKEITLYLKRLRKLSGAKLRYLMVAEPHTKILSGYPHFHMLIHECDEIGVNERLLRACWPNGHSKFNLVNEKKPVGYVTKYISKDMTARTRASIKYGDLEHLVRIDAKINGSPTVPRDANALSAQQSETVTTHDAHECEELD